MNHANVSQQTENWETNPMQAPPPTQFNVIVSIDNPTTVGGGLSVTLGPDQTTPSFVFLGQPKNDMDLSSLSGRNVKITFILKDNTTLGESFYRDNSHHFATLSDPRANLVDKDTPVDSGNSQSDKLSETDDSANGKLPAITIRYKVHSKPGNPHTDPKITTFFNWIGFHMIDNNNNQWLIDPRIKNL